MHLGRRLFPFIVLALATSPFWTRAAAAPTSPVAPVAWRTARWSMTVDDVLKALPGEARKLEKPIVLPDGNSVSAEISEYTLAGTKMVVRFVFDGGGKLALVSLRTPEKQYAGPEVYAALRKHLAAERGGPGEESKDDNFVDMRQTRWKAVPTSVDLKFIPGTVVVLYHPTPG